MKRIRVKTPSGSYSVCCGRGLLARAGSLLDTLEPASGVFLISSPRVYRFWGKKLTSTLRQRGLRATLLFDDAEAKKNMRTVERLCRVLVQHGADRQSIIVALGGGVVGDVAGYVAASYARGVRIVQVPSTLVAQVDSAIGGKTGVNLPEGKNLIGAFHQPSLVIADPQLLSTLPEREYRSGLYEVIKYGVIGDLRLFRFLERRMKAVVSRDPASLEWMIERCVATKADIVSRDERESGLRMILNFGHTVGHALEAATRYRRFLHGEAVGWGMIAIARFSAVMELLPQKDAARVERLVLSVGSLPPLPRGAAGSRLLQIMRADKKAVGGKLRFVLANGIGRVRVVDDVPEEMLLRVLAFLKFRSAPSALEN